MKTFATIFAILTLTSAARAQEPTAPAVPGAAEKVSTATEPETWPAPLPLDDLAALNGRQGSSSTILSDQDLTAVNYGNTVNAGAVSSGQIVLGPGTFNGFAGVGNFVINSGHNNNLQGAITINIVAPQ